MPALPERPLVLLVEDDPAGRLLFTEWLRDAGFRVDTAHNGLQALARALEPLADLILTDLHLPGIDGYELTRRHAVLSKPCDPGDLSTTLHALIAEARGRRTA